MAPLTPHWVQPSHPDVQEVLKASETEFLTKSLSKVSLPPFAVFAKMSFPPCNLTQEKTYATVQCGKDKHLDLNSDLLYINHSCEPSLIFDTGNFNVLAGPKGLKPGDELTFFYPSTEWSMAQPFSCFCGTPACRGTISGARDMTRDQLSGVWINGHIRELKDEQEKSAAVTSTATATASTSLQSGNDDPTAKALKDALESAEAVVEAARSALRLYTEGSARSTVGGMHVKGVNGTAGHGDAAVPVNGTVGFDAGPGRRGTTSRELSGEMGGDTVIAA